MTRVKLRKTVFDRWIVVRADDESLAWSGSRWVGVLTSLGFPADGVQVSNLGSLNEAKEYAGRFGFEIVA